MMSSNHDDDLPKEKQKKMQMLRSLYLGLQILNGVNPTFKYVPEGSNAIVKCRFAFEIFLTCLSSPVMERKRGIIGSMLGEEEPKRA